MAFGLNPIPATRSGGIERFVQAISCELAGLGHSVTVMVNSSPQQPHVVQNRLEIRPVPWRRVLFESRAAAKESDLVHAVERHNGALAEAVARAAPRVTVFHNAYPLMRSENTFLPKFGLDYLLSLVAAYTADHVVAANVQLGKALIKAGVNRAKISCVSTGVDTAQFHPFENSRVKRGPGFESAITILFVGRIVRAKGLDVAVKALAAIHARERGIRFKLVGPMTDARFLTELTNLAGTLGVLPCLDFVGEVPPEALPEHYQGATIFLYPTRVEGGQPLALLEAMANALPVVTTNIPSLTEFLANDVAVMVPPGDPTALAASLDSLLDNPGLCARMGSKAREVAIRYHSWRNVAESFVNVYRKALENRHPTLASGTESGEDPIQT
jgi:glycosyltransferase involved in cell wall biosynthesis